MIHTIKMIFPLHYEEVAQLQKRLEIIYTELSTTFKRKYPGVTMSIYNKGKGEWMLSMVVDVVKLLQNAIIEESDYQTVERKIKYILYNVIGNSSCYNDHVLMRIDYRYDVVIKDFVEKQLLLDLYKKLTRSHKFQKKHLGKVNAKGEFEPYETTVYHSSNSAEAIVYSKEAERIAKDVEPEEYEKNVIRYEVRLMSGHLYYMEKKGDFSRPRKLKEYMTCDVYRTYFKKYMSHIYHSGRFYKLDEARKIIKASSLSVNNKIKIIEFLKKASSYDLDTPLKGMGKSTLKSRLKMLEGLEINPILIPKNYRNAPSSLENPLDRFLW